MAVHGSDASVSFDVRNTLSNTNLRAVEFQLPSGFTLRGGAGPAGWTVTTTPGTRRIRFAQTNCAAPGVTTTAPATFRIDLTAPSTPPIDEDRTTDPMTVVSATDPCSNRTWSVTGQVTFPRVVLRVTGVALPTASLPVDARIQWTVTNVSRRQKTGLTPSREITPATGWGGESCDPATLPTTINPDQTVTVTCSYRLTSPGTYTIRGNASASRNATGAGAAVTVRVGSSAVSWARAAAVAGRPASFEITVVNDLGEPVQKVELTRPDATWTGMSGSSSSLTPAGACGANGFCFTGSLAPGASATFRVSFTAAPSLAATATQGFQVTLTPASGTNSAVATPQLVTVFVPPNDVERLTVLSDAEGQTLAWTNTDGPSSSHDGVVVFRTAGGRDGVDPPLPEDFVDYSREPRPPEVIYADRDGSPTNAIADPAVGEYNYRVCNRDANLVYSSCRTGFWNGRGFIDSARAPAGGWTHQLGGFATLLPGIVPGNRVGLATNRQEVNVLDLATGHRSLEPYALAALPSAGTPATRTADGRLLLFAADSSGAVTAVNLETGQLEWQRHKANESFVAGVSGITRAYAAPAFQAAYAMDVLLLASTSGRFLAIDARNGDTLWTVNAGSSLRAAILYDPVVNRIFVPTQNGGVLSYDMGPSAPRTTAPAVRATSWQNPGGQYTLHCIRTFENDSVACIDRQGRLRVLDSLTGAVRALIATSVSTPSTLARVVGTAPGFAVGNASTVRRITATYTTGGSLSLAPAGTFNAPSGVTLSAAIIFSRDGFMVVAGSDLKLHKLSLADAQEIDPALAPTVTSAQPGALLGPIAYDGVGRRFVFGTSEGRIWAVPRF